MGKSKIKSKSRLQAELKVLNAKKRNGLIQLFGAIVLAIIVVLIKTTLESYGVEWATNNVVNMIFYLLLIVMAAVAGLGGRKWSKSRREADDILVRLNR